MDLSPLDAVAIKRIIDRYLNNQSTPHEMKFIEAWYEAIKVEYVLKEPEQTALEKRIWNKVVQQLAGTTFKQGDTE